MSTATPRPSPLSWTPCCLNRASALSINGGAGFSDSGRLVDGACRL
ncbi:MAG: hypothetical protein WCK89_21045 [bacterium]